MIAGIMQPYFFPYIGYFQLMAAVDLFIIYDDAQYMKGGWVNRNRILNGTSMHWWTYAVRRDHFRLPINRRHYDNAGDETEQLFAQLHGAYRNAPYFRSIDAWLRDIWPTTSNVAAFNQATLEALASQWGLACQFTLASSFPPSESKGEARVIELCTAVNATTYVNASGGSALYDRGRFHGQGIALEFIEPQLHTYAQFGEPRIPALSIIDVLMFNGFEASSRMVRDYRIAPHD